MAIIDVIATAIHRVVDIWLDLICYIC